jgi:hypothetical protein
LAKDARSQGIWSIEEIEGNKMKNKRSEGRDREKEGANASELRK